MQAIYAIVNKINGHRYIGSTIDFERRKKDHLRLLRRGKSHCLALNRAWKKYGAENFVFFVLEEVSETSTLIEREQWWIDNTPCRYNCCPKAGTPYGRVVTDETKQKMRVAKLGKKHSAEQRANKSKAQGGENHWAWGKEFSSESRKKMSESHKRLYASGYIAPASKAVLKLDDEGNTLQEYVNSVEAARELYGDDLAKKKAKNIQACIYGQCKKTAGFRWAYK